MRSNDLAAGVLQPHRRVQHPAVAARVEIGAADEHHRVDAIEHLLDVLLALVGRHEHRQAAGLQNGVEVSGRRVRKRRRVVLGGAISRC